MAEPSKLFAGVSAVYGPERAKELYGELIPVPAERIVEATEGLELNLAGRVIRVFDTPGHARHHVCYFDTKSRSFFTGDTFGLSYRALDVAGRPSIFPTTTPVQFEPEAMHASVARMEAEQPAAMYLTHYAQVTDVPRLAADLHRLIDAHVAVAERHAAVGEAARR
jgi:hydroxyacylglutathione hydrolase